MVEDWVYGGTDDGRYTETGATGAGVCERCGWPKATCACGADVVAERFRQPRPPMARWWLTIALLVVGLVLALTPLPSPLFPVIGWLLVGPAAILSFGEFVKRRTEISSKAGYGEPAWLREGVKYFPILVVLAVAAAAWPIAEWAGRQ